MHIGQAEMNERGNEEDVGTRMGNRNGRQNVSLPGEWNPSCDKEDLLRYYRSASKFQALCSLASNQQKRSSTDN